MSKYNQLSMYQLMKKTSMFENLKNNALKDFIKIERLI